MPNCNNAMLALNRANLQRKISNEIGNGRATSNTNGKQNDAFANRSVREQDRSDRCGPCLLGRTRYGTFCAARRRSHSSRAPSASLRTQRRRRHSSGETVRCTCAIQAKVSRCQPSSACPDEPSVIVVSPAPTCVTFASRIPNPLKSNVNIELHLYFAVWRAYKSY